MRAAKIATFVQCGENRNTPTMNCVNCMSPPGHADVDDHVLEDAALEKPGDQGLHAVTTLIHDPWAKQSSPLKIRIDPKKNILFRSGSGRLIPQHSLPTHVQPAGCVGEGR